jgi:hypothetical protein
MSFTKKSIAYLTNAQLEFVQNDPTLLNKFNLHYTRMVAEGKASAEPIMTYTDDGIFLERHFTDQAALDEHLQFCNTEFTPLVPDAEFPTGTDL